MERVLPSTRRKICPSRTDSGRKVRASMSRGDALITGAKSISASTSRSRSMMAALAPAGARRRKPRHRPAARLPVRGEERGCAPDGVEQLGCPCTIKELVVPLLREPDRAPDAACGLDQPGTGRVGGAPQADRGGANARLRSEQRNAVGGAHRATDVAHGRACESGSACNASRAAEKSANCLRPEGLWTTVSRSMLANTKGRVTTNDARLAETPMTPPHGATGEEVLECACRCAVRPAR